MRSAWFWLVFLVGAASVLRLTCARGNLWLDEIWSIFLAREVQGLADILFHQKIDNNHPLNTWILSFMPMDAPGWLIRTPACIAGGLTAGAAFFLGRRWHESLGLTWGLLFAFSYLMVHYSSEARGYAFLILFCLFALIGFFRTGPNLPTATSSSFFWPPSAACFPTPPLFPSFWGWRWFRSLIW